MSRIRITFLAARMENLTMAGDPKTFSQDQTLASVPPPKTPASPVPSQNGVPSPTGVDPNQFLGEAFAGSTLVEIKTSPGQATAGASTDPGSVPRYTFLQTLGEGGMGRVFVVQDKDLLRQVALKMLITQSPEMRVRFLEEAQVMGQLDHPNILTVHELGVTTGNIPYYTMPVVRGTTLHDILDGLRRQDPALTRTYSLARLVQIFLQIANAMQYAHEKGVIHRDLKPMNIMVGEHAEVLVLDWGLAKVVEKGNVFTDRNMALTRLGQVMGTPAYMSPEQAAGQEAGMASDIYALGVMLYEILTLRVPFVGSTWDVVTAHLLNPPEPPSAVAREGREVPAPLEKICLEALKKGPEQRPASAKVVRDAVHAWLESELMARRGTADADSLTRGQQAAKEMFALEKELFQLENDRLGMTLDLGPDSDPAPLFELGRRLEETRNRFLAAGVVVEELLIEALGRAGEPGGAGDPAAHGFLAWYYKTCLEREEEPARREFFQALVQRYGPLDGEAATRSAP